MRANVTRFALCLAACATLAGALAGQPAASGAGSYNSGDPSQAASYRRALQLGVEAYVYGYPLLDTDRVFKTSTSVNVPNGAGGGPVNQFSHVRLLADARARTVIAPNHDTLYSLAWLDLSRGPIVIHMPAVQRRFCEMELVDPYTNMFAGIGSVGRRPGDYAIVPPSWHRRLPRGVRRIRSRYTRVWIIGRTYIKNAADTPNVVRVQNQYSLTPLGRWGTKFRRHRPTRIHSIARVYAVPGTRPGEEPLAFFDALGDQLKRFPPPVADRPLLDRLAEVGIGPGMHPSAGSALDPATRQGLRDAIAAGKTQVENDIRDTFLTSALEHNGWLVSRTGRYGTDYTLRVIADALGLGAPVPAVAIYPFTITDNELHPLTGARRYVAHISPRFLPFPARAFWSLTLYDSAGFFVRNRAGIYLINNRSNVHYNGDGSLDIYIQPRSPRSSRERRNWLPSPAGQPFRLIIRLYVPRDVRGILDGRTWQPPTILPCLSSGRTSAGTSCAR